jgi:hypothetical protein
LCLVFGVQFIKAVYFFVAMVGEYYLLERSQTPQENVPSDLARRSFRKYWRGLGVNILHGLILG